MVVSILFSVPQAVMSVNRTKEMITSGIQLKYPQSSPWDGPILGEGMEFDLVKSEVHTKCLSSTWEG